MAHGLVGVTQAARRQDAPAIDDHRVQIGATQGQTVAAHRIDIRRPAEGTAVRQFTHKGAVRHVQTLFLMPDGGIGKVDLEIDLQVVGGGQAGKGVALADLDRAQHADGAQRCGLTRDARLQDAGHKGGGGAVQNGNFGAVDRHQRVVDAGSGQRGHDMFDRREGDALTVIQQGAQARRGHVIPHCRDVDMRRQVRAAEDDAVTGRGGMDVQTGRGPGMKPNALKGHRVVQRRLHGVPAFGMFCGVRIAPRIIPARSGPPCVQLTFCNGVKHSVAATLQPADDLT